MTVHELHDALNLLSGDLITAADRWRTAPNPRRVPWKRMIPAAACLAVLVSAAWAYRMGLASEIYGMKEAQMETAVEAPAAMAPAPMEQEIAADEAKPEAPAAEVPAENAMGSSSVTGGENGMEEELCIDHSHRFAEAGDPGEDVPSGYCGNMLTTVYLDEMNFTLAGSYSVTITDILINLNYDPNEVCRCMAEFTVDTEMLPGIEVNLTEGFARCEKGQAALTEQQAQIIQEIIDSLA